MDKVHPRLHSCPLGILCLASLASIIILLIALALLG